jgi:integrase/recombinase XerD
VLGTPAWASALEAAFTAAFGQLAPSTRARHLSALRSALAWWAEAGWVTADPTAGWARPKVPVDTTQALTRAQVAAIWKLDVPPRTRGRRTPGRRRRPSRPASASMTGCVTLRATR